MTTYDPELHTALAVVRAAARLCRSVQSRITVDVLAKKDNSPVTVADLGSQAVVCRALGLAFPDDPVVGEEDSSSLRSPGNKDFLDLVRRELAALGIDATDDEVCRWVDRGKGGGSPGRFWTLDPIDGTKGFLRREQYAIALALIVGGQVHVAALACPNLPPAPGGDGGSVVYAVRGRGSWSAPLDGDGEPRRVRVSAGADPAAARFCESVESGHSSHGQAAEVARLLGITREPLRMDSQAKYAVVARGEAEIYLRLPTRADYVEKIWDHAAGALVVEEAGGTVTDAAGRPLEFCHGRLLSANRGVVVSNGPFHAQVVEAVGRALGR